jgi:formate dehydrogenase subunit delta
MQIERLVKMANEIATFFASESPPGEAAPNVATHLTRFWDPRMRREIMLHAQQGGAGLSDLARAAVALLKMPAGAAASSRSG